MAHVTYAIGDVHGRADLLESLLAAIAEDADASGAEPRVLFLGDIVDRGPCSREAMDLVCDTLARWPRSRLIRGNHDAYFLDFMTADQVDEDRFGRWLRRIGGYQTMESYGLLSAGSIRDAADRFRADHASHLQALKDASPIVVDDRFAYVHAGIDPSRPVGDQDPKDLMMIRDRFLDHEGQLSHIIVHGHTPTSDSMPDSRPYRIAIDTGAYASGRLTCLAISADERNLHFLFATASGGSIKVTRDRQTNDRFYPAESEISGPHSDDDDIPMRCRVGTGSGSIFR
ncbi:MULTISPECIES: metallophosphoesterase [unclassified Mesorhizobium]|uniref:metallophosphoesterase n=1 Tax=unclassified Mesorhizobium TaxID=325217 RepID=UPI00142F117D|nr:MULTISPECIES: metallophosphoesterase [unclassified Mesorhizobium]